MKCAAKGNKNQDHTIQFIASLWWSKKYSTKIIQNKWTKLNFKKDHHLHGNQTT